jgi:hypothetical protein
MKIASTIQQVNKTKSQNAVNKGTNNNANNSAAVAQSPRGKTDTVTLSKKSLTLASKTATKSQPKVEKTFHRQPDGEDFVHRLGVALVANETDSQSSGNRHDAEGGSGNSNAVSSMSSLSNNISAALESYKGVQKAEGEINHVL